MTYPNHTFQENPTNEDPLRVRCPNCRSETPVPAEAEGKVRCKSCGRQLSLAAIGDLGATAKRRLEAARRFAKQHRIDVASAFSVRLGLIPLENCRRLDRQAGRLLGRGPGEWQAGPATKLATVSLGIALGVAVLVAVKLNEDASPPGSAAALVIASPAPAPGAEDAIRATSAVDHRTVPFAVTDVGPTRVEAATPMQVLQDYCASIDVRTGLERCVPLRVESTRPHRGGVRLGVLADGSAAGELTIWIRRHPSGRGWFADNGGRPIEPRHYEPQQTQF